VQEQKVVVVPNGYDDGFYQEKHKEDTQILTEYQLKKHGYLLFVGTLQPRKNIIKLVQAFRLMKEKGYGGKLVIAGKIGWLAEETLQVIKKSQDAQDIVMTGYISSESKRVLYRHADVFVLPSLYEGFGVPVLEAMATGCPVVAANNSSIPEVVGHAGILFDAADPVDMVRAVEEIRKDRSKWVEKGLAHAKQYSWDLCAQKTLDILLSV
jgi:glycosyltransferase involved in cell wall biosynthesis